MSGAIIYIYQDAKGRWRYRIVGGGHLSYASEQGYRSKWYARRKAQRINPAAKVEYL